MTRTRWIGLVVAVLVADAIAVRFGLIADPIPKLAGTAAWTTSRAAGVTAFAALTLDVVFGLFVSTGAIDRWVPRGASVDVHKWLSSVSLAFVALHSLALLGDASVHFDALDALVPWLSSYRPGAIADADRRDRAGRISRILDVDEPSVGLATAQHHVATCIDRTAAR